MVNCYKLTFKVGKSKKAKEWPGEAKAELTKAVNRYHCGSTVGHGFFVSFERQDQPGDKCRLLAWFDDGRVVVALPWGGVGTLGRADINVIEWPEYVPLVKRAEWAMLPLISLVKDNEIIEFKTLAVESGVGA